MTSPDLWPRIEQLYHAALLRDERERLAFVNEASGGNETLQREVESLLSYANRADGFMAAPAIAAMTPSPEDPGRHLLVGFRLGPYEIGPLLGAGGMGDVYRARDTRLGRSVAIKILPAAFITDVDRQARFEREARLLAALNHPHIGAIYGLEHSEGIHGLVLELVEGHTLADLLRSGPVPVSKALTFARQIAEALEAAHEKGIVHRDLKPANIAITRDGDLVKVLDFGLAKANAESAPDLTRSPTITIGGTHDGVILGTAAYMSPEQARGQAVDKRTDIWAFGCVLLEMLTGRKVFASDTVSDTVVAILSREPDWSALPSTTPSQIRRLLRRCLEKDAKRRLRDIADALIEIDEAGSGPVAAAVERGSAADIRSALSRPVTVWTAAASAAVLVTIGVVAGLMWRPRPPASSATLARVTITVPAAQVLERGRFTSIALSPDGTLLVYAAAVGGGRTSLFLRPLDEFTARPIAATQGASTPFFSPDGRWLAFYADGLLKKVPVAGGVPLTICEAPPVWSATWGENDRIVFATMLGSSGLWLVSAAGGEPAQITTPEPEETQHGYPQLLPGGRQVLFSVRRQNAWRLALLALETRNWKTLGNGRIIGEGAQYVPSGHLVYAQAGGLVATPFDPATGDLDQPPVPLLERVEASRFGGASFAFAAGAGTLAYVPASATVADRALLRVERDGHAAPLIEARAAYASPSLSPDGRQLAVTIASETGSDIWIVDVDRATRVRFTSGGASAFPLWGPDGSRVAFHSTAAGPWNLFWKPRHDTTEAQPFLAPTDSTGASWPNTGASLLPGTLPTLSGAGPQFPASWAPDGSVLAFHERKPSGERDIWTVAPGGDPMPFLLTAFDERSPRFSPDGKWLAYVSDESGRSDVYVQPFPGPGQKWLVSTSGGFDPVWSRDGRELFYREGDQMMSVLVAAKAKFSAGRPRRLFEIRFNAGDSGPNYDVSPDGAWFVMAESDRALPPGELHVVLNWLDEVKARAQPGSARQSRSVGQRLAVLRRPEP